MKEKMKSFAKKALGTMLLLLAIGLPEIQVQAEEEDRILSGIYVEDMSLEGKTTGEAEQMITDYVNSICGKVITLLTVDGNEVQTTPAELGFSWSNQDIVKEAVGIGQSGNVIQRYKSAKDLQFQNKVYQLEFSLNDELAKQILSEQCSQYNVQAIDATLSRTGGSFTINPGQTGKVLDEDASLTLLVDFFNNNWNRDNDSLELVVKVEEPRGTEEELSKVKDVLGTFTTSYSTSNSSRSANVSNGCSLINGSTIYPGDEFSTYEAVAPFTKDNGYFMAGSYVNGKVVDSIGGGICQVSTTLYNAVLLSELEVTERHNHSMIVTYVDPSADAAIAESAGKDFRFINNTGAPIYIEGSTTSDKHITFTIYGMETRDSGHKVKYESEVVSTIKPDREIIYTSASQPVGSVSVQSAHIGYKANLWKVVTENGVEVSREMINSSSYAVAPRTATVGVFTEDPAVYEQIMAAIATNNIDHVKGVAAALAAGEPLPVDETAPEGGVPQPAPAEGVPQPVPVEGVPQPAPVEEAPVPPSAEYTAPVEETPVYEEPAE